MNTQDKRDAYLKRTYGITLAEYDLILKEQGGMCAGCHRPPSDFTHSLHVDHDHSTRLIRGLLCWNCNRMIPNRRDVLNIFRHLVAYLELPPAVYLLHAREMPIHKKRKKRRKRK